MEEKCGIKFKYLALNIHAQPLTGHFDMINIHEYKSKTASMKQPEEHLKSVKAQTAVWSVFVRPCCLLVVKLEDRARLRSQKRGGLKGKTV